MKFCDSSQNMSLLRRKNSHPRDERIEFIEDGHLYLVDSEGGYVSVTTFVHMFFQPFDAREVLSRMRKSHRWETSPYHGMSDEDIMNVWEMKRTESASMGTLMHQQIEAFYNDEAHDTALIATEWEYFQRFHADAAGWIPYRTEWYIFDEEHKLAGSVDMIFQIDPNNDTDLVIVDWKRTADLKKENKYQKGLHPVQYLDDCNYIQYCLQLNVYKYILQKNYGKHITAMYLVILYPSNDTYIQQDVPDMQTEVLKMLRHKQHPTNRLSFLRVRRSEPSFVQFAP